MPVPETLESLSDVQSALRLALGNDTLFTLINTRLILQTGIDLKDITPVSDRDADSVSRVLGALGRMGFSTQSLLTVAKRRSTP